MCFIIIMLLFMLVRLSQLKIPGTTSLIKTAVCRPPSEDTMIRAAPIWSLIFSYWPSKQAKKLKIIFELFIIAMLFFQGIFNTNDQRRNEDLHQYIDRPQSPQAASNYQVKLVQYASVAELRISIEKYKNI